MDDNAFTFSLDLMKIYNIKKGNKAIHKGSQGPTFLIFCFGTSNLNKDCYCLPTTNCNNYDNQNTEYEINGGSKERFSVSELKVYKINFNKKI